MRSRPLHRDRKAWIKNIDAGGTISRSIVLQVPRAQASKGPMVKENVYTDIFSTRVLCSFGILILKLLLSISTWLQYRHNLHRSSSRLSKSNRCCQSHCRNHYPKYTRSRHLGGRCYTSRRGRCGGSTRSSAVSAPRWCRCRCR